MRRLRIYLTSIVGGLAGASVVLAISSRIERRHAEEFLQRMHSAPPMLPGPEGPYGFVMGSEFGPGMFTWYLVVLVFASVFYLLLRWQDR
jgi:hypothetical protein